MFNIGVGFRRFYLLLWKNFILQVAHMHLLRPSYYIQFLPQIRRPIGTVFELVLPLLATVLVIAIK